MTLLALALMPAMLKSFTLGDVKLLDSPFRQAMERNAEVLLKLEPDRFLHNTRLYAGLEPKGKRYGGWESRGIAGHSLGHYLTALSQQFAATSDRRFQDRIDYIVAEMAECQERYGDGYVGALPPLELATLRGLREGKVETDGGFGFKGGAWVPWYTQHKILAGLKDAWLVGGCPEAKAVTLRLADWVDDVTKNLSPEAVQRMLAVEHGGMNETLADLYAQTAETRYRDASRRFYHRAVLDPLLAGRDELPGKHANTQIPKVIGEARAFETGINPDGQRIAENFWRLVTDKYTFAMGGNSDREHFFRQEEAAQHLSPQTAESCNTYNMLRLSEHLFAWQPRAEVMDFYERALYNHILASQDPKRGMYAYFMSLKPGHFRTFSSLEDSFWCCFGSGMENHTKYGEAIYFHGNDELYVNLFIPSELQWRERGLVLRQTTDYPRTNEVELTVESAPRGELALHVRCPGWATKPVAFALNGQAMKLRGTPGSYATIRRTWQKGDRLRVTIPIALRKEPLKGDPTRIAFLYGPLALAGDFGAAPEPYAADHVRNERAETAAVPTLRLADRPRRTSRDRLEWRVRGVALRPYNELAFRRTTVYWEALSPAQIAEREERRRAEEAAAKELAARTVDELRPGEQQSEVDHAFASENAFAGEHAGRKWRDARNGGFLQFRLRTLPDVPQVLRLTYWGGDAGRVFDILVEGEKVATVTLTGAHPGEFFREEYLLPRGKESVSIRLQAAPGSVAGGLYGALVLRSG